MREPWGISNRGLFRPVPRDFQRQKKPSALLNWPQPRRAGEANYNFSPTIRLSCFPQQTNHSLFDFNTTRIYQTLTLKQPSEARDVILRTFLAEGIDRRTRDYRFLERIFHTFNNQSNTHRQSTKLHELLASMFSTFNRTVGEVTRARDIERSFWSTTQRFRKNSFVRKFALVGPGSAFTEVRNHFISLPPLLLADNSNGETVQGKNPSFGGRLSTPNQPQRTTNLHTHLDHQFLISAKNVQRNREFHYGQNVFTTLALGFAAPKVSEVERVAQRISQFVSAPELTHIKRQQAMSEEMINALRGLRMPHTESTPAPVPVMPSIEQLTSQVRTQLERELRIERERRGL